MNRSEKEPFLERLRRTLDIPADALGGHSHIEVFGFCELELDGCSSLEEYSDSRIVLLLCDGCLTVIGEGLELSSFSNGAMRVNGQIRSISFEQGKGKGG